MLFCSNHLIVIMNKSHIAMVLIYDDNPVGLDVCFLPATIFLSIMVIICTARCTDRACLGILIEDILSDK